MNTVAPSFPAKPTDHPARRLMTRMNMTLFYCLGAAVLIESAARQRHASTDQISCERARWLREYAGNLWPEFSWETACHAFARRTDLDLWQVSGDEPSANIATRHRAAFYAALAHIADDVVLRAALDSFGAAEQCAPGDEPRHAGCRALAAIRRVRAARRHVRYMREVVLRRAFDLLQQHWLDTPPFPAMPYGVLLGRAWSFLRPHAALSRAELLLHASWFGAPRAWSRRCDGGIVDASRPVSGVLPEPAVLR